MDIALKLHLLPDRLAICRLEARTSVAAWMYEGALSAVTRTADELSVVCAASAVPEGVRADRGWCCLQVAGPLDFALTGVLAALAVPLAAAGVSLFAVSTFDTDYLLVREAHLEAAVAALTEAGHDVAGR